MIEPTAGASSTAAIVVVAADELDLQKLVARLERRYGTEYAAIGLGAPESDRDADFRWGNAASDAEFANPIVRRTLLVSTQHLAPSRQAEI